MSPKALEARKKRMADKLQSGNLPITYETQKKRKANPDLYEDWRAYNL